MLYIACQYARTLVHEGTASLAHACLYQLDVQAAAQLMVYTHIVHLCWLGMLAAALLTGHARLCAVWRERGSGGLVPGLLRCVPRPRGRSGGRGGHSQRQSAAAAGQDAAAEWQSGAATPLGHGSLVPLSQRLACREDSGSNAYVLDPGHSGLLASA